MIPLTRTRSYSTPDFTKASFRTHLNYIRCLEKLFANYDNTMQTAIILIITILSNALANVFIKLGTQKLPALDAHNIWKIVGNGWIMLGALLFVMNFPLYNIVLQRMKLSIAFPLITSSAFAVALLVSVFVFHESLRAPHYAGFALLVAALWLLAR